VNASCAQATAGNSIAAATSVRQSERARFEKFCMESIRHKGSAASNARRQVFGTPRSMVAFQSAQPTAAPISLRLSCLDHSFNARTKGSADITSRVVTKSPGGRKLPDQDPT
jgi:hypothetical protein